MVRLTSKIALLTFIMSEIILDTTFLLDSFRLYTEFSDEDFAKFLEFCHLLDKISAYQKYFTKKYPLDYAQLRNDALRIKPDTPENIYKWLLETRPFLLQRVPQHYIANYLGILTETISRIRKKLVWK